MAADGEAAGAYREFKALSEVADRKFARARDLPLYGGGDHHSRKAFKAYTRLWRLQQERRRELVAGGLRRWEIGEVASRIGQLYYARYLRTAEPRSLVGAYVFYEAIYSRGYFGAAAAAAGADGGGGSRHQALLIRYKELRFIARFLVVAMLMRRAEAVDHLAGRLRALVEETKAAYPKTNFKEWKQVLQELGRFLKADGAYKGSRSLRYDNLFDSYPSNLSSIARFHSKRVLKLKEAVLTSYRRNEIKFTELTLDTFRMLQCLEWEPTGSYQIAAKELTENGTVSDQSGPSGLIDIHLSTEISDGSLPSNPQKAIIYHPTAAHLLAVLATICEELSQDSILLIYISASGSAEHSFASQKLGSSSSSRARAASAFPIDKPNSHISSDNHLWLGPRGSGGPNNLYPEDLIPFTRYPLFLVIDSENSHAFKAIHNAEKGEPAALLLSPRTSSAMPGVESTAHGSQFTYFLTAPMQAFCQLAGITSDIDTDTYANAENILFSALEEYEGILCTSVGLNNVWGQILPDPFLRRLILRFIFCRAVLFYFHSDEHEHLPTCLPSLPESVSPNAEAIRTPILSLAENLVVSDRFNFARNKK
ncbi:uncharacterized protein [Miscanthus floridulus]|uniref:uncharacterized protein isoform X1 n=1 Tax=Miscanthus floridulus TaxID=154761 RepID=UPI003457FB5A